MASTIIVAESGMHEGARLLQRSGLDVCVVAPERLHTITSEEARVVIIDGELGAPHIAEVIRRARAGFGCTCVLSLGEVTGSGLMLASAVGADAVVAAPLDPVVVGRLVAQQRIFGVQRETLVPDDAPPPFVGNGRHMTEVWRLAVQAAATSSSALITGETGTGKEVIARAIHRFSARRHGAFVAVNCAALPEALLGSELFGHEKGSFTGAGARHKGRFELADGGTLFLDEIGDLPPAFQVALLRVLEERQFERVGGSESVKVDVRVLAATHRDLRAEVERGRFRADLYYRLDVLSIAVPPLRERKVDIPDLWRHFLKESARAEGRETPITTKMAVRALMGHDWPGNVRELRNVAHHVLATTTRGDIDVADLPPQLRRGGTTDLPLGLAGLTLKQVERAAIMESCAAFGTIKEAAEALGVSERKMHYKLKQYREESASRVERERTPAKVRVLLAEDDDELRWVMSDFLRAEGYDVTPLSDGRALIEYLGARVLLGAPETSDTREVIVSDVRMPGLTGVEVLERIRAHGWSTPVVLISAFGDAETRRIATDLGADAFLAKPIDAMTIHRVIEDVIRA